MKILEEFPQLNDEVWVDAYDFSDCWTRKNPEAQIGELDCAVAVLRTAGVPSDMGKLLGRSRAAVISFVSKNPHIEELLDEVAEHFLDQIEKLHKTAALEGDLNAQRFILTTLGKKRGYVTRQEQEVQAKTTVVIEGNDAEL